LISTVVRCQNITTLNLTKEVEVPFHSFLSQHGVEVSSEIHAGTVLPQGGVMSLLIEYRLVGAQN
jgi:hypothetical protein